MKVLYEIEVMTSDALILYVSIITGCIWIGVSAVRMVVALCRYCNEGTPIDITPSGLFRDIMISGLLCALLAASTLSVNSHSYIYQVVEWDMKNVNVDTSNFEIVQVIGDDQYIIRVDTIFLEQQEQVAN